MANLKIGRNTYDINENDVVLFNGACWMLTSRKVRKAWSESVPGMSKTLCKKLLKKNILILSEKKDEYVTSNGQQMGMYYYKFDMDKLKEFVGEQ